MGNDTLKPIEKLNLIIRNVDLRDVYITEAEMKCFSDPFDIDPSQAMIEDTCEKTGFEIDKSAEMLYCLIDRRINAVDDSNEDETGGDVGNSRKVHLTIRVMMKVCYAINYEAIKEYDKLDDALSIFARTNAVYNAHPYYREFIHSCSLRMKIPPIVQPLLKPFTGSQINKMFEKTGAEKNEK